MKATTCFGRKPAAWLLGLTLLAGCGKGAYEAQLEATVDAFRLAQLEKIQKEAGKPATTPAAGGAATPAAQPAPNPAAAAPGAARGAAATGAAQTGGLSPVGQAIVAPLE